MVIQTLRFGGVLVLLMPMSLAYSHGILLAVPVIWWSNLNGWLVDFYWSVGLHGVPFRFSWSWMTVFLVQIAFPYGLLVLVARILLFKWYAQQFRRFDWEIGLVKMTAALLLAAPLTLVFLRWLLPVIPTAWADAVGGPQGGGYWAAMTSLLLMIGLPYALLVLTLDSLLSRGLLLCLGCERQSESAAGGGAY